MKTFAGALGAFTVAILAAAPGIAQAGLMGSTVHVTARYPNTTNIYADPGAAVVTGGVEYLSGSFAGYNSSWQVDVQDDYMTITDAFGIGLPFGGGVSFNGFVLEVLSGPAIVAASINGGSTIVPLSAIVDGGALYVNFQGVGTQQFGTARIDFRTGDNAAVPEPATWALLIAGFAGSGAMLRRRRSAAAA